MKRILPLLLAALLAIGATGCRASDPKENKIVLGDIANVPTDRPDASTPQSNVPSDARIGPKKLTEDERQLVDLVTSGDVSLFHYAASPEWKSVSIWVEPYIKGKKQPDIGLGEVGLGGVGDDADKPTEGDLMIEIEKAQANGPNEHRTSISFSHGGAKYALSAEPFVMKGDRGGHAIQTISAPLEIVEGQDIILRVDCYNPNTVGTVLNNNELSAERIGDMAYVFAVKCRFSKSDSSL